MYLTETIWRFCTADVYEIPVLYKHYLSNKSKYEWILTHWDDTLDDEIVTSQSFRALLYYLNDHGQCPSSIDGLKSSTQSNSHPEFAKASSFYSAEFAELKKYESEYLEMPLTVLFDNLFRKADTAWREHGLKEERRILRGNPLLKTEVYTYFPTIARKDVDKFLLSGPAVAELFHREYLAQAWGEEEDDLLKFDTSQLNLMGSVMDEEGDTHNIYVRSFADRTPKEMTWLWPGRVPSGTIVILSGNKSVGKTVCLLDWAARVTTGADWPDGSPNTRGPKKVLLCSREDDPEKQTLPRLMAAGANVNNILELEIGLKMKGHKNERKVNFDVKRHLEKLTRIIIDNPDICVLILDPVTSYIGSANINKDDEIRPLFDKMMAAAQLTGLTILALVHSNKRSDVDSVQKIMGASSVTAVARTVWTFAEDAEEKGLFHMALAAGNNLKKKSGFEYHIVDAEVECEGKKHTYPKIQWGKETECTADDVLSAQREKARSGGKDTKGLVAFALIKGMLPAKAKDVYAKAEKEGISIETIKREKSKMGDIITKQYNKEWWWWFKDGDSPWSKEEKFKEAETQLIEIMEKE